MSQYHHKQVYLRAIKYYIIGAHVTVKIEILYICIDQLFYRKQFNQSDELFVIKHFTHDKGMRMNIDLMTCHVI